jgi:hypothetical protein
VAADTNRRGYGFQQQKNVAHGEWTSYCFNGGRRIALRGTRTFTTTHKIKKELSICQSFLCLALTSSNLRPPTDTYSLKTRKGREATKVQLLSLDYPVNYRYILLGRCDHLNHFPCRETSSASEELSTDEHGCPMGLAYTITAQDEIL